MIVGSLIARFRSKQGLCLRFIVYEENVNCQLDYPFFIVTVYIAKLQNLFRAFFQQLKVLQFLSGVVPLTEMAGFTTFLLQLLALHLSTLLNSGHPPTSDQSSLSPLPLASSRYSSIVLAFPCHSLQDPEQPSKHIVIPPQHMPIPSNYIRCC